MCDRPIKIKTELGEIPVACGKCPPCYKRRVDSWVFRLQQEDLAHKHSHFLTLTYDTRSIPISKNGFMTLDKSDFQNFMKRLRKLTPNKIRYYACGEYGEINSRPHYHAIVFGVDRATLFRDAWLVPHTQTSIGQIHVGKVSGDSIAYTTKYLHKKKTIHKHKRDDRVPEFSLMSKGLGSNYLTPEIIKYHRAHLDQLYVTKRGGHRIAMPRYYRNKIWNEEERSSQIPLIKNALDDINDQAFIKSKKSKLAYVLNKEEQRKERLRLFHKTNSKNRTL